MKTLARFFAFLSAALSALYFYRIRSAAGVILILPKIIAGSLAPYLAVFGLVGAFLGLIARAPLAVMAGLFGLFTSARYVWGVVSAAGDMEKAFGPVWPGRIPPSRQAHMLAGRWTWQPPVSPEPRLEQNVTFWALPGSNRALLCDIWQPPADIPPSGLAFLYFHGSGWHFLDKDTGTRPMFRHLAAQGHVVMDVAYRLCPEADWRGMQDDVKRAIAWMKANAARYGVSPRRIVVAGGSAGAHLALLAAYTAGDAELRPADVGNADLTVAGVVSWYGPTDLRLFHEGASHVFSTVFRRPEQNAAERGTEWLFQRLGINTATPAHWQAYLSVGENMMRAAFGGTLAERPAEYRLASPVAHAGRHCPPTLLFQGEHDCIVPAEGAHQLAGALRAAAVPVVHIEYPQTEHAFDLLLPRLSPPAQAALYETERFLALLPSTKESSGRENGAIGKAPANGQAAVLPTISIAAPN